MRGRFYLSVLSLLLGLVPPPASAAVGVSVGISVPGVQIGINVPAYPELVPVPAYPVYYAPGLPANYFFYDGLYWVYANDTWYSSSWYNGPWYLVEPAVVPVYVLRVPVRYYRVPPPYFRGWAVAEPPRWGAHWGPQWEARHRGWDRWDHRHAPAPAPLPVYQRQYAGDRYPTGERQHAIRQQQYHFEPRDAQVRERLVAEARHDAERDRRGAAAAGPTQQEREQRDVQQQQQARQQQRAHQQQQREPQAREQQARQRQQVQEREQQQVRQQQQTHERQQQQAREQQQQKQAERHAAERARAQKQPRPPERGESPRDGNGGG
ncbi:MAG TPA: hypothetical protein VLJ62_24300 [Burkholderiaceae bacterium]|nr:hypothetical protein [Burkholderiaceae bacterium]